MEEAGGSGVAEAVGGGEERVGRGRVGGKLRGDGEAACGGRGAKILA